MRACCGGRGAKCGRAGGAGIADGATAAEADGRGGGGGCDRGARARLKGRTGAGGAAVTGMAERCEVVSSAGLCVAAAVWDVNVVGRGTVARPVLQHRDFANKSRDVTSGACCNFGVVGHCHDGSAFRERFWDVGVGCTYTRGSCAVGASYSAVEFWG